MKNKFTLLLLFFVITHIISHAQYVAIPDTTFRNDLMTKFPGCFNAAKQMDTTCVVQTNISPSLAFVNLPMKSMDGIQYFKNLTSLIVGTTDITSLPPLPTGLTDLNLSYNSQLTSLPALPSGLVSLACQSNALTSLPTLPPTILYLICSNNPLNSLPILPNGLSTLICSYTPLTNLPALPNSLKQFICNNDSLTSLPTLSTSLQDLDCSSCPKLTSLPALPFGLKTLVCDWNNLSLLPPLPLTLKQLTCNNNMLTSLPALPDSVTDLYCDANLLTALPALPMQLQYISCTNNLIAVMPTLPASLLQLNVAHNQISVLPPFPNSLTQLFCDFNQLTSLPALPTMLKYLQCNNNNLTALPSLPDSILSVVADYNQLTALSKLPLNLETLSINNNLMYCLPFLPSKLTSLIIFNTGIVCLPNLPNGCSVTPASQGIICNTINNSNQCQSYPQIYGLIYNDNNNNNIKEPNERGRENIRVQLSNGAYAYTNVNGVFNISADTIGSYNVTIASPNFYDARPLTYVHNFSSYNTSVNDTFALKSNTIKDSLAIHITPLQNRARPGFAFLYNITCENVGTTVLKSKIVLKYDIAQLLYDSSSVSGFTQVGDSLILNVDTLRQGDRFSLTAYYTVKTTALLGSSLVTNVYTQALSAYSMDSSATIITGSYDPNDKQATPEMSPIQVSSGNFIEYLIRFQNTGNDTAHRVVISDTLSNLLQKNVLQMLGTSHLCKTTLNNGIVYFEFLNIMLPDSNVNKIKSTGFVRFLIKPDSAVALGDIIPNKASIYFDYNTPIVTNTCNTIIKNRTLPLRLISYKASLTKSRQVLNEWVTANEVNTAFFNIQRSTTGKDFKTISKVNAASAGERLQTYQFTDILQAETANGNLYYRLEMWDKDGTKSYSPLQRIILSDANNISIYPNPAHDVVTIQGKDMKTISIADNAGRLLMNKNVVNRTKEMFRIHQLSKGLYLLKIMFENGQTKTEKLVIE